MNIAEPNGGPAAELVFAVAANFTAEPIGEALRFWTGHLWPGFARVEFTAYNQIFQEFHSPDGLLTSGAPGINLILIRLEDWARDQNAARRAETLTAVNNDFIGMLLAFMPEARRPAIVLICPPSRKILEDVGLARLIRSLEADIRDKLLSCRGVTVLEAEDVARLYPVETTEDAESDLFGHIPFTKAWWTAAGTTLARTARSLLQPAFKAIAVDADNTLWGGVAAEAGAKKVDLGGVWRQVQEFLLDRKRQGMLLVLVSKNRPEDVNEVFRRPDMVLRQEDFAASQVNWNAKSENLRSLAAELNLGLESFLFLDDNPVECAEVAAHCPSVTVLPLPPPERALSFLRHVWAFDLPPATAADRDRTGHYRRQAERRQLLAGARSFPEFFARLELLVEFVDVSPERIERAAQLTRRTNQFNATGLRRTETELAALLASGQRQALMTRVRDRFGDYGEVGLCVYSSSGGDLEVDTFLLSCRVLSKGVEHQMVAALGRLAEKLGKEHVVIPLRRTARNEPAAKFLEAVGAAWRQGDSYRFSRASAQSVRFDPGGIPPVPTVVAAAPFGEGESAAPVDFGDIAHHLALVPDIQLAIRQKYSRIRPALAGNFAAPRNPVETKLAEIWADTLGLDRVGIHDDFFDLGGDSVQGIQILSRINQAGLRLSLAHHFEFPSIAGQARFVTPLDETSAPSEPGQGLPGSSVQSSSRYSLARLGPKSLAEIVAQIAKTQDQQAS